MLLVALSYLFSSESFSESIEIYDNFFKKIGQERVGIEETKIDSLKDPFILKQKKEIDTENNNTKSTTKEKVYNLKAIINKRVKINNNWLTVGDSLDDFKIIGVKSRSVIISNGYNKKEIFLREKDAKKIKFFTK